MKKQNPSIKAQIIRSAFILLAFTAMAALPFALAQRQNSVKQSFDIPSAKESGISTVKAFPLRAPGASHDSVRGVRLTQVAGEHTIDLGKLGIHPAARPPEPMSGAVGTYNAYMGVSPDVVAQSCTSCIGTLLSSFTPAESVDYYINGVFAATF